MLLQALIHKNIMQQSHHYLAIYRFYNALQNQTMAILECTPRWLRPSDHFWVGNIIISKKHRNFFKICEHTIILKRDTHFYPPLLRYMVINKLSKGNKQSQLN